MPLPLGHTLLRGLLAGATAGLTASAVGLLYAEPVLDAAIALEGTEGQALFSRTAQKGGLVLGLVLVGCALGLLFALVWRVLPPSPGAVQPRPWHRSLALGLGAFLALYLLPFLRYPANPPGVGDAATVDERTSGYLLAIAGGLLIVTGTVSVARSLTRRGWEPPARHVLAGAGALATTVTLFAVLPDPIGKADVPALLLYEFRLRSLALQATLYLTLAAAFGYLSERPAAPGPRVRGLGAGHDKVSS